MGRTPGFVSAYGLHVLYLGAVLVSALLLRRSHRIALEEPEADPESTLDSPRATSPHAVLFPYEAAYLAGGASRVAETALAALLEEGWIDSTPSGRLHLGARSDLVTSPDPVGIPVLAVVASGPPTAAREIRRRSARLIEVADASRVLYARRLLVARPTRRGLRRLRWAVAGLLALAGAALVVVSAARSQQLASPPVVVAAASLLLSPAVLALAVRRPLFRTELGEIELDVLRGSVRDKARWVASRVWSDQPGSGDRDPWADLDRIVDALQRPAATRPVQLAWLWGREDALMAVALRGPRAIPDRGLRRGLDRGGGSNTGPGPSTGLSTTVHKMVRSDDA